MQPLLISLVNFFLLIFEEKNLIIIFLVKGNINKNPIKSVKKPGTISKSAATPKAAPDIIS